MLPISIDEGVWSVGRSVGLSVCLSVCNVSPARKAEPIEMPFGILTWVGPRNHLFDGVQIPTREGTILRAKRG